MNTDHNRQKKIALINDFSGFGRCSVTVALPIISALRVQCCPVLTSVFSNHTGFPSCFFEDYTDRMQPYIDEWKKLGLRFSAISSGFLGSKEQIAIVLRFFREFKDEKTWIVVDPVMGDHGKTYATYTPEMCEEMKRLVACADILTPNLTEACILTGTPYHEGRWQMRELHALVEKLHAMGPDRIVITGILQGSFIANYCYETEGKEKLCRTRRAGEQRSGTGDIFAAIIAADAVNGVPFGDSVQRASQFIKKCIEKSDELGLPATDGVCFEELLHSLKP